MSLKVLLNTVSKEKQHLKLESAGDTQTSREITQQRKLDGLLKLVKEKNQQIESLKNEMTELKCNNKSTVNHSILMSDLNTSYTHSSSKCNEKSVKNITELLERELEIYHSLNGSHEKK